MKRLYVLTRNDLGLAYQAVQGAHAVAQFMLDHPNNEWKNGYLIFLAVDNEDDLKEWRGHLQFENDEVYDDRKKVPFSLFYEPDLDDQLTAIAVYTTGNKFKNLPIMQQDDLKLLRKKYLIKEMGDSSAVYGECIDSL